MFFRKCILVFVCFLLNFTHFSHTANAGTVTYKYDALGRVIEVIYSNGTRIFYTYDKAGNRTKVVKTS